MEKQDELTLMKARSYRSVLMAGFRLYTENFRRLFKASWLMALLYAAICGAFGTLTSIKLPEMTLALMQQLAVFQAFSMETMQQYALTLAAIGGLLVLAVATMSLASATLLDKLQEHRDTGSITTPAHWWSVPARLMGRTVKGVLLTLLVILAPLLLFLALLALADAFSPQFTLRHLTTVTATFGVCTVVAALLALPLMHVLMKYLMEAPCGYWRTLSLHYGRGMRHWGMLLLVFFLSSLLVQLTALVVMMPAHILNFANQQAYAGQLIGDPLGMPGYILPLTFGTLMLCSFLQFYISQVTLMHNYYAYGSIEAQETEREQQKLNIQ